MITANDATKSITTTAKVGVQALAHGVKVGAADEVNKRILSIARKVLGDKHPALENENFALVATAYIILLLADQRLLPKSELISSGALLALEAKGRDLLQPLIAKCLPDLEKLAELCEDPGKKAPKRGEKTK